MNALPVCAPLKRYSPRLLTPMPKPSRAMLRVKSPPALSEWPPLIHVRLSLIEKAFCFSVRSTFRPASTMLSGRIVRPPGTGTTGTRNASGLARRVLEPETGRHLGRLEIALPFRVVVVVAGPELVDHRRSEDLRPAADDRRRVQLRVEDRHVGQHVAGLERDAARIAVLIAAAEEQRVVLGHL